MSANRLFFLFFCNSPSRGATLKIKKYKLLAAPLTREFFTFYEGGGLSAVVGGNVVRSMLEGNMLSLFFHYLFKLRWKVICCLCSFIIYLHYDYGSPTFGSHSKSGQVRRTWTHAALIVFPSKRLRRVYSSRTKSPCVSIL
jgi:hypothetical protein